MTTAEKLNVLLQELRDNDELEALHEVTNLLQELSVSQRDACRLTRLGRDEHNKTIQYLDREITRIVDELGLYEPKGEQ